MPKPGHLEKARLTEMWPGDENVLERRGSEPGSPAHVVEVQFNPATLKLSLSNQAAGGTQAGGSSTQFLGQGTTKLSLELWFDVTLPRPESSPDPQGDVRKLTEQVAFFMRPKEVTRDGQTGLLPPAVEFQWGTFLFKGTVDSMDETLELFSEDGKPLRAGVTLSISKQDLKFEYGKAGAGGAAGTPSGTGRPGGGGPGGAPAAGTQPLQMARAGDTVQAASARAGVSDWKSVAVANGIENPRRVDPGALLNLSGAASAAASARLGLSGATAPSPARSSAATAVAAGAGLRVGGSGSTGLPASAALRFTGPTGNTR